MNQPVEYEQTDARWANVLYTSRGDKSQTIGTSGCGPTCAAMVAATLRPSRKETPVTACAYAVEKGYRTANDGTAWGFFGAYLGSFGIPCRQTASVTEAIAALKQGYMVITAAAKGIWTTGGHFILAWGLSADGSKVYIHDPNSEASHRELANIANYRQECTQFWLIEERWEDEVEIQELLIKDLDRKTDIAVQAVNLSGSNYIRLRDVEKLCPVWVDWDGSAPTIRQNFKE